MSEIRVILVTAPTSDDAAGRLAREIVSRRLAACVNVIPGVRSIYRWQGAVCDDAEDLLVIKTRAENVAAVSALMDEHHPYEVPEVIALPVAEGARTYLDWVLAETAGGDDGGEDDGVEDG